MKAKLTKDNSELSNHREKWQGKLDKLNKELNTASDDIYRKNIKERQRIQEQNDKTASSEAGTHKYIEEFEEYNLTQSAEVK